MCVCVRVCVCACVCARACVRAVPLQFLAVLVAYYVGGSKLVQVGEYRLHGNVESMATVQLAQSKRESLLLSFKDAKVSLAVRRLAGSLGARLPVSVLLPSRSCQWWSGIQR